MAPKTRIEALEKEPYTGKNPKKAAVMALFYAGPENLTYLLFILRKQYEGVHSNQIGFPGGRMEKGDSSLLETAIRESREEVGIDPGQVSVIRSISELYIPPSNFLVTPYLGLYNKTQPFVAQESEVETLIEVPLTEIMDEQVLTTRKLATSYAREIEVPAFELGGHIVWGATAMMLSEIKELFKMLI